jgi:rubrerythrin
MTNYKHQYEQMKLIVDKYQNEIVPGLRKLLAEREPVRYGVWKPYQTPIETRQSGWICTCCSGVVHNVSNGDTDYCPNCGAKMDGESHE